MMCMLSASGKGLHHDKDDKLIQDRRYECILLDSENFANRCRSVIYVRADD